MKPGDYEEMRDCESGCSIRIEPIFDVVRGPLFSVQYDGGVPVVMTDAQLDYAVPYNSKNHGYLRLCAYHLLMEHLRTAHADMSYVELAAR